LDNLTLPPFPFFDVAPQFLFAPYKMPPLSYFWLYPLPIGSMAHAQSPPSLCLPCGRPNCLTFSPSPFFLFISSPSPPNSEIPAGLSSDLLLVFLFPTFNLPGFSPYAILFFEIFLRFLFLFPQRFLSSRGCPSSSFFRSCPFSLLPVTAFVALRTFCSLSLVHNCSYPLF